MSAMGNSMNLQKDTKFFSILLSAWAKHYYSNCSFQQIILYKLILRPMGAIYKNNFQKNNFCQDFSPPKCEYPIVTCHHKWFLQCFCQQNIMVLDINPENIL